MPSHDPTDRSTISRIAALSRWASEDPSFNAVRGQAGLRRKFEIEVDPDRTLSPEERERRTEAAWRAHLARMRLASGKAKKAKAIQRRRAIAAGVPDVVDMSVPDVVDTAAQREADACYLGYVGGLITEQCDDDPGTGGEDG